MTKSNFQVTKKIEPFQKFVKTNTTSFFLQEGIFSRWADQMAKKKNENIENTLGKSGPVNIVKYDQEYPLRYQFEDISEFEIG